MAASPSPRVLVTRAAHQGSALADRLRALGAEPVLIPAIEITTPTSFTALDTALEHLSTFHWLLFTSANAVEAFAERSSHHRVPQLRDAKVGEALFRLGDRPRIAAIGPATAHALQQIGLTPDLIPPQAIAESLTEALLLHARQPDGTPTRLLLLRAEDAREHLPETLRTAGAEVTVAPAYRTVIPPGSVNLIRALFAPPNRPVLSTEELSHPSRVISTGAQRAEWRDLQCEPAANSPEAPVHAITFTSSSSVRNLLALCEAAGVTLPAAALRISIGPITSETLRDLDLPAHAEAPEATVASLAETVRDALLNRG